MTPPHTIFFDATMTVLVPHPGIGAIYAQYATRADVAVQASDLDAAFRPALAAAHAVHRNRLRYGGTEDEARAFWRTVVEQAFQRAAKISMPPDPYFEDVFEAFATPACWRVFDDVPGAIRTAREAGCKTALLSNFDPRLKRLLPQLPALRDAFDHVFLSCDLDAEKPDAAAFVAARQGVGATSGEALALIGDSVEEDIAGALAAGWRAVLLDRRGGHDSAPKGSLMANDLQTAVELLLP